MVAGHPPLLSRPGPGRIAAWGAIVVLVLYLLFLGGTWPGLYDPRLRILSVALALAALLTWAVADRMSPVGFPRSSLLPGILLAIASLTASALVSRIPRLSFEYVAYAVLLWGLYLLLVRLLADPFFRRRLLVLAAMLFAGITTVYLAAVLAHWISFWQALGHFAVPPLRPQDESLAFGNPSALLVIVVLLAVPTAALIGLQRTRALVALGVLVAVVAITTGSRGGWFGLGMSAVITSALALSQGHVRGRLVELARQSAGSRRRVALTALSLVLVAALAAVLLPAVLARLTSGGEDIRSGFAAQALRMFEGAPLLGVGPGMWVVGHVGEMLPTEPLYYIPHAHNVPLQTLAELGILGALAGLVLIARVIGLVRGALADPDPRRKSIAHFAVPGLLYIAFHEQIDVHVNFPALLFAGALPIAYLDATRVQPTVEVANGAIDGGIARPGRRIWLAGLVAVVLSSAWLFSQERSALLLAEATAQADAGNWGAAAGPANQAAAAEPEISSYTMTAALAAAHRGEHARAAEFFQRVAEQDDLPEAWLDLAAERAALGETDAALVAIRRALRVGIQDLAVSFASGELALRLGDRELATEAFSAAIFTAPSIAGDPWWSADDSRREVFEDAAARAASLGLGRGEPFQVPLQVVLGSVSVVTDGSPERLIGGAFQWGTYTYRRSTPLDLLVPGLLRLRLE